MAYPVFGYVFFLVGGLFSKEPLLTGFLGLVIGLICAFFFRRWLWGDDRPDTGTINRDYEKRQANQNAELDKQLEEPNLWAEEQGIQLNTPILSKGGNRAEERVSIYDGPNSWTQRTGHLDPTEKQLGYIKGLTKRISIAAETYDTRASIPRFSRGGNRADASELIECLIAFRKDLERIEDLTDELENQIETHKLKVEIPTLPRPVNPKSLSAYVASLEDLTTKIDKERKP